MKKLLILSISALFAATMVTGCASKPKTSATAGTESKKRTIYISTNGFSKNLIEIVTKPTAVRDSAFTKVSEENPMDLMAFYIAQTETTYERWYEVYTWATANGYTFACNVIGVPVFIKSPPHSLVYSFEVLALVISIVPPVCSCGTPSVFAVQVQ